VSSQEADSPRNNSVPEMEGLETAIDRAVAEVQAVLQQAKDAEERAAGSDELLRAFAEGTQDPGALSRRIAQLEAENDALRRRIRKGRDGIDQILAQIRFLEHRR